MVFLAQSTPEYFTIGKANVAALDERRRTQHAMSMCMIEAGHEPPGWRPPRPQDKGNLAVATDDRHQHSSWFGAFIRARDLVHERTGHLWLVSFYPSNEAYDGEDH
jgi:hypothetical protein